MMCPKHCVSKDNRTMDNVQDLVVTHSGINYLKVKVNLLKILLLIWKSRIRFPA
jgi:hypothetical protein